VGDNRSRICRPFSFKPSRFRLVHQTASDVPTRTMCLFPALSRPWKLNTHE
jgi:hypothetical protein